MCQDGIVYVDDKQYLVIGNTWQCMNYPIPIRQPYLEDHETLCEQRAKSSDKS